MNQDSEIFIIPHYMVLTYWLTISELTFAYYSSLLTFPTVHQLCYWSFIWIHESLSLQVENIFVVFKCIRCWKFKQNFRLNHLSSRFASVTVNLGPTFLSGESFFSVIFSVWTKNSENAVERTLTQGIEYFNLINS